MHSKKSQAALEFIMTYGWAILVVLVAIGALAYFGVLNPDRFLPSKCTLPAGIVCLDHAAYSSVNEIDASLKNSLGYDITSVTLRISGCSGSSTQQLIKNGGDPVSFAASDCNLVSGRKFSGQMNVSFTNSDTGVNHVYQGTIITKIE